MNLFFQNVLTVKTWNTESLFIWLEGAHPPQEERPGAGAGSKLALILPSECGHGDSRTSNVIFMLFIVISEEII